MKSQLPLIEFKNVSKTFSINPTNFLRNFILGKKNKPLRIIASSNLEFSVNRGQIMGLYGPNGSGKSTILRLAAGILQPDSGQIVKRGSLASVIELGSGLHFELTGEENIKLYATILGIPHYKIDELKSKAVEFAGIREFLNVPLKYYSTGMRAKLATAIAIFADTDILLLDEAITVGDGDFREKFLRTIKKIKKNKAIMFTTHDFGLLHSLSDRVLLLDHGNITNTENEIALWRVRNLPVGKKFSGIIQSNSMYPLLKRGDKVKIIKTNFSKLHRDDVIAFVPSKIPQIMVHRVAEIHKQGKEHYLVTKGDASIGFDVWKVVKDDFLGKVVLNASKLKNPF